MGSRTQALSANTSFQIEIVQRYRVFETNSSVVRVRGILHNNTTKKVTSSPFRAELSGYGDPIYVLASLSIPAGGSQTIVDKEFTIPHDASGFKYVIFTVTIYNTYTSAFGTPGSLALAEDLLRIPKPPAKVGGTSARLEPPNTMVIGWQPPDNMGADISGYQVDWDTQHWFPAPSTVHVGWKPSMVYGGFTIGTNWWFRVRAQNSMGYGPWSDPFSYYIPNVPGQPAAPNLQLFAPNSVQATLPRWPVENGATVTSFDVSWSKFPDFLDERIMTVYDMSTMINDLDIDSYWFFRYRARNSQGVSGWGPASSILLNSGPRVHYGGQFHNTIAYVHYGGEWHLAVPYVHYNGEWRVAGG